MEVKVMDIELDKSINEESVFDILVSLGWKPHNLEKPGEKWDFSGCSRIGGKLILHMNPESKKDVSVAEIILKRKLLLPPIKFTWESTRKAYDEAEGLEEKVSILAQYLGLEKPLVGEGMSFNLPTGKERLNEAERAFLGQKISSFDIPFGYCSEEGKVFIAFQRGLPPKFKKLLPNLIDIWRNPNEKIEVNFDVDSDSKIYLRSFIKKLTKRFKIEDILARESSRKGHHVKIVNQLFEPEESLKIREEFGDSPLRLMHDKAKLKAGLECNFLYEYKGGLPSKSWKPAKGFL